MDDNATCHRTLAVQDCLDSEGIQRLVWPARSPDLNPIENVWMLWGRQAAGRNYPPTNKNTLIRVLTEEWDKLPQQLLDNVVQSMNLGSNPGEGMVVCKCIVPLWLNNCRALNPHVRLVEEEKLEAFDHSQGVLSQNWSGTKPNRSVNGMVLKATDNDMSISSSSTR
ncbi:transposable element Tcb2 transposase [Trichonephila clavipes]|nr:transposable element Tcb2 transposase [Trichonephila clavipes]